MPEDPALNRVTAASFRYMYESMHIACQHNAGQMKARVYTLHQDLAADFDVVLEWWRQFGANHNIPVEAWSPFHELVLGINDKRDQNELGKLATLLAHTYGVFNAQGWWTRAKDYCRIILPPVLNHGTTMRDYLPRI